MKTEETAWLQPPDTPPPKREHVIVVCDSYRCLGYWDGVSQWRQFSDNAPIHNVVGWIAIGT